MTITDQITRLAEHRDRTLARCSTSEIVEWIAAAADLWRLPNSRWLERAGRDGAAVTGFSPEMIWLGLRDVFEKVTRSTLSAWAFGEIGGKLDGWEGTKSSRVRTRLVGPRVVTHIFSGNLPSAAFQSLLCGLLVKAANVCKCASGDPLLPRLFAESLMEVDEELGRCVLFVDWKGGDEAVEREVWSASDAVIVSGSDETVASVRRRVPANARFLAYGHRVSVACVAREALTGEALPQLAEAAAYDVSMWDQQGCLSPHCIYVEEGGGIAPLEFADALATEMERFEAKCPRGKISDEEAAAFMRLRGAYDFRASADKKVRVFGDATANRWAVIYEEEPMWATSCLNRLVFVKPIAALDQLPRHLAVVRGKLSCVGFAGNEARMVTLAELLAPLGISRVCPLGSMQRPPLDWHHDGRPTLGDLVRWVDAEVI
jgi:hypothetical protein